MTKLRNVLVGAGIAAVGAVGTKLAVDYLKNKDQEEPAPESEGDQDPTSDDEIAYAVVEPESVQTFLDASFGDVGRYKPTRPPKVFEYQGKQYMVIWARDNMKDKNQMLTFVYTDEGRQMLASVGYTPTKTDYNISLGSTPFAVEVGSEKLQSGQGTTEGASDIDLVLA